MASAPAAPTDISAIAALLPTGLTLRPTADADLPFLREVYAATRADELAQVPWSAEQKQQFVAMQFEAQRAYYVQQYPTAAFLIVLRDDQPIGRLYLDRWPSELRVVDIALLPQFRGQGLGSTILQAILAEGQRLSLPVTIHVEIFNPALRLYSRLGFTKVEDKGVYYLMEKRPDA